MPERPTRILLIEDNPGDAHLVREMISEGGGAALELEWAKRLSSGLRRLADGDFDAVLLDLWLPDSYGFETFARVHAQAPEVPIVVLSGLADDNLALRAVREGAQDYLVKGQGGVQSVARCLRYAIERHKLLAEQRRTEEEEPRPTRLLAFIGAKGGVGTTTAALNIAAVLAERENRVIAVELRAWHGEFAYQLGNSVEPPRGRNLGALIELPAAHLDAQELKRRLIPTSFGVQVLLGPQRFEEYRAIDAAQVEALLGAAAQIADYVLLDLPPHPTEATRVVARACHSVILVVEREPVCLKAAGVTAALLREWGVREDAISALVMTRAPVASSLSLTEVGLQLGCRLAGYIPSAEDACPLSYKLGVPLAVSQPELVASVGFREAAGRLAGPVAVPMPV